MIASSISYLSPAGSNFLSGRVLKIDRLFIATCELSTDDMLAGCCLIEK